MNRRSFIKIAAASMVCLPHIPIPTGSTATLLNSKGETMGEITGITEHSPLTDMCARTLICNLPLRCRHNLHWEMDRKTYYWLNQWRDKGIPQELRFKGTCCYFAPRYLLEGYPITIRE